MTTASPENAVSSAFPVALSLTGIDSRSKMILPQSSGGVLHMAPPHQAASQLTPAQILNILSQEPQQGGLSLPGMAGTLGMARSSAGTHSSSSGIGPMSVPSSSGHSVMTSVAGPTVSSSSVFAPLFKQEFFSNQLDFSTASAIQSLHAPTAAQLSADQQNGAAGASGVGHLMDAAYGVPLPAMYHSGSIPVSQSNGNNNNSTPPGSPASATTSASPANNSAVISNGGQLVLGNGVTLEPIITPAPPELKPWTCPSCKVGFSTARDLQQHLSAHAQDEKTSQDKGGATNSPNRGGGATSSSAAAILHAGGGTGNNPTLDAGGSSDSVNLVPCGVCGKLFTSNARLQAHLQRQHGHKNCSCQVCGNGFSYRCKLEDHMRTHTDERPYRCAICGRGFRQRNHMTRHAMIHTGERPFPCEICGRTFYRKDKLTRHIRTHAVTHNARFGGASTTAAAAGGALVSYAGVKIEGGGNNGSGAVAVPPVQPYVCDICSRPFSERAHLSRHRMIHTGETPYACETCGKAFYRKDKLARHVRTHTGERPYVCNVVPDQCNKMFQRRDKLTHHMFTVHGTVMEQAMLADAAATAAGSSGSGGSGGTSNGSNVLQESSSSQQQQNHAPSIGGSSSSTQAISSASTSAVRVALQSSNAVGMGQNPLPMDLQYSCLKCGQAFSQVRHLEKHKCAFAMRLLEATRSKNGTGSTAASQSQQRADQQVHLDAGNDNHGGAYIQQQQQNDQQRSASANQQRQQQQHDAGNNANDYLHQLSQNTSIPSVTISYSASSGQSGTPCSTGSLALPVGYRNDVSSSTGFNVGSRHFYAPPRLPTDGGTDNRSHQHQQQQAADVGLPFFYHMFANQGAVVSSAGVPPSLSMGQQSFCQSLIDNTKNNGRSVAETIHHHQTASNAYNNGSSPRNDDAGGANETQGDQIRLKTSPNNSQM